MQRGTTDGTAHGRGAASAISGWTSGGKNGIADGASIDQVLANAIGGGTKVKSLIMGNKVYNYHFFTDGPRQVHPVEPDPKKNFDRLFTGFLHGPVGQSQCGRCFRLRGRIADSWGGEREPAWRLAHSVFRRRGKQRRQ